MAKKATAVLKTVAVLDDKGVLIGKTTASQGIDFGDLPTDGSYKWDEDRQHFVPLGHGFGKVKTREPYEPALVQAAIIDTLESMGATLPVILTEWRDWYNQEMRRRHEELSTRPR